MAMKFKRTLATTDDGDLAFNEDGELYFIDGPAGVAQELRLTLATIRGEDPFAPNHGLRVFEVASASEEVLEREIRLALEEDDRVASIESVDIDSPPDTEPSRNRSVSVTVELVDESAVSFEVSMS